MELVKITYRFADGHVEQIEVEPEVAEALQELDQQEYNNTQKETRRHTLISAMEYEGQAFVDQGFNTEWLAIGKIGAEKFWAAFRCLKPKQQDLLYALYLSDKPVSQAKYAARHGICEQSVWQNAWRAKNSFKKYLEKL